LGAAVGIGLPWWRNHAILVDFYDYGLQMAGVGRIAHGERPYVDFLTPIQSLFFRQGYWMEQIFGARYLSLTYGNAVLMAVSLVALGWLLRKGLGAWLAWLVAGTIVVASSGQHTIVWHNALGVTVLAAVVLWSARPFREDNEAPWIRWVGVSLLLWVGGMTKLTYQVAALCFALLLVFRDGVRGRWRWGRTGAVMLAYGLAGTVLPVASELHYTGATFADWWKNVVELPGSRVELLRELGRIGFYLYTPHDHYPPLYFPFVGAWGVGLVLAVAVAAIWGARPRDSGGEMGRLKNKGVRAMVVGGLIIGAGGCPAVFLATNFDIAYLAGAASLTLAVALALALGADDRGQVHRAVRWVLAAGAVTLLVPAWVASWQGTRALWGPFFDSRAALRETNSLPGPYAYFSGMRVTPSVYETMRAFAEWERKWRESGGTTERFYFTNSSEWLTRAFPAARIHGFPLWLHKGTSYRDEEAREIQRELGSEIEGVVSFVPWNKWYSGMDWYLATRFTEQTVGLLAQVHVLREEFRQGRDWRRPAAFAEVTGSRVDVRDWKFLRGPWSEAVSATGGWVGAPRSSAMESRHGWEEIRGEFVLRRAPAAGESTIRAIWRVTACAASSGERILQEQTIELPREEPERAIKFDLRPGGDRVRLEFFLPPDERLEAGFRRIDGIVSGEQARSFPGFFETGSPKQVSDGNWAESLFRPGGAPRVAEWRGVSLKISGERDGSGPFLFVHAPGEIWLAVDADAKRLSGEFGAGAAAWREQHALPGVIARVLWVETGKVEVLHARELRPKASETDRGIQRFDVMLPERRRAGWLVLSHELLVPGRNAHGHFWWRNLEFH
jgi:hypothetical protein